MNLAKERLARKMGAKNASVLLDRLGKNKQFINAIESPAGLEIMSAVIETIADSVDKFMQPFLSEEEWCGLYKDYLELQASLRFNNKVIGIINQYNNDKFKFNKAIGD